VILTQLTIRDFRNLLALDVELPPDGAVIVGENGHGKTNFLEAIYYLVLFRSLRGAKDRELVRFDEAGFFVAGTAERRVTVGYEVSGRKKKVTLDRVELKKLSDGIGTITAVAFSPADRTIVSGGPAGRRRYLDVLLSLSEPGYLSALRLRRPLPQLAGIGHETRPPRIGKRAQRSVSAVSPRCRTHPITTGMRMQQRPYCVRSIARSTATSVAA
jgi:DNA replication and repair protein RecF